MCKTNVILLVLLIASCYGRKHHLEVRDDIRRYIPLSTFGFYEGGTLDVQLTKFQISNDAKQKKDDKLVFGLSLDKSLSDAMNPYLDSHQETCILKEPVSSMKSGPIAFFLMNFTSEKVTVTCSKDWVKMHVYESIEQIPPPHQVKSGSDFALANDIVNRQRRSLGSSGCTEKVFKLELQEEKNGVKYYKFNFALHVVSKDEEGMYNLYFHACPNYNLEDPFNLNFDVDIEERNRGNFLSAGEMPLPALYFMMSILFFLSGIFWVFILRKSKHPVFKIHYLMAVLVFLKSMSLMFHAINYHYIEIKGEHVEAWAILYYITHLLKGAVLFVTIILIGTGWTFIKHIIADKDKKLFMIVIPLQILANVAEIIIAESEEGDKEHSTWRGIFILVDLLCCGAILFPVVWSIRHLQEAANIDGKAAINLRKLKLFRQFYIMIVCYIYFTRIIVYLLKITVAFQYAWLDEMFKEMATYVFFVMTAYKFRPVSQNPYFTMEMDEDDDDDEVEILTQSGLTQTLTKVTNRNQPAPTIVESNEDERENLINKRESSHEYD